MRIELPIIDEPGAGLCVAADVIGSRKKSKILIATGCYNTFISEALYNKLEHCELQPINEPIYGQYYINDITEAKSGVIKALPLPGHTLTDVPVVVTKEYPAYRVDMVLGTKILYAHRFCRIDTDTGFVTISDEEIS